ncbi:MAG: HpcH/HpaI aldolase/citrate lyase family protein [Pirellulaceae bacterium]
MRNSKALARLRGGETVRTCSLGHVLPYFVCHAARSGFDCIWLDMEHRAWDRREIQALLTHFRLYDIDCMLRVSTRERAELYRFLEDGATGLMMPHISTPEQAEAIVAAAKFPPLGDRGIDNTGLDSNFYVCPNNDEYTAWANRETFVVIQIETPLALENVDAIAAVPGVDVLFLGPGDLGLRLRHAGDRDGSRLEAAYEQVAAAARRHKKAWGCPVSGQEELRRRQAQGAQLLPVGGEFGFILRGLNQAIQLYQT